ncbi:MAG TPA: hypothetical protein VL688_05720 [Verrucomicrobiae bacterium]|jgi:hypothetical protein|nr:hypothetical protein [Verrucomicrobiae bacterium]
MSDVNNVRSRENVIETASQGAGGPAWHLRKALLCLLLLPGCARLFGWDIHAPGLLSQNFYTQVAPSKIRVGLYITPRLRNYISTDKGTRFSDPQNYHIGEALTPLLVEGFQQAFEEFIYLEVEPTPEILRQYAIPYFVAVDLGKFHNYKTMKGQAVVYETEDGIFDTNMNLVSRFTAKGSSDAQKVFAKKGGPEVNLNAALENNVIVTIQYLQDFLNAHEGKTSV